MQAKRLPARLAIGAILLYRNLFSSQMLHCCRLIPSCSTYALDSVDRYGILRGGWMASCRLLRCHPFSAPGADPVR